MSDVVARLAEEDDQPDNAWSGTAKVTSINAGTTRDGRRLITVRWQGGTVDVPYLASYTPVLNHRVAFLKNGASFLVIGNQATA